MYYSVQWRVAKFQNFDENFLKCFWMKLIESKRASKNIFLFFKSSVSHFIDFQSRPFLVGHFFLSQNKSGVQNVLIDCTFCNTHFMFFQIQQHQIEKKLWHFADNTVSRVETMQKNPPKATPHFVGFWRDDNFNFWIS